MDDFIEPFDFLRSFTLLPKSTASALEDLNRVVSPLVLKLDGTLRRRVEKQMWEFRESVMRIKSRLQQPVSKKTRISIGYSWQYNIYDQMDRYRMSG